MDQRFGQLYDFRDKPDDAPSLVTPTRRGAEPAWTEFGIDVPDLRLGLERARRLILASQIDQALTVLEAVERLLDDLSPPVATRYRAATEVLRLAIVAFQDDSLAALAIVVAQVFVEGGAGLGMLLTEARSRMGRLEATDHRPPAFVRSAGSGITQPRSSSSDAITARERDVLLMVGQGYSNKRIARMLEISPETVKSHVKHIFSKLDVATRGEAVSRAVLVGLL